MPSPQRVSAALAAAQAHAAAASARVRDEGATHSLAEMAQRDLDAALQLLADRAQYITGASGAAIALRRDGRNDMLCRASTGTNAPELGALLSTEFGLSGESVRTRQLLRCDDTERDARVNREVCRQLGIASVVVMPVVNDDQVLGVFELFSGKANAFGERDLSAVQRLSQMVETAVRLAQATETLPERLRAPEAPVTQAEGGTVLEGQFVSDLVVEEAVEAPAVRAVQGEERPERAIVEPAAEVPKTEVAAASAAAASAAASVTASPQSVGSRVTGETSTATFAPLKKTLFWSAALDSDAEGSKAAESDQSHVPPVLRGLRKCEACGFPISAGRVLCVECEEKKWRGQLRRPQAAAAKPGGSSAISFTTVPPAPSEAAPAFAAAAPTMAKAAPESDTPVAPSIKIAETAAASARSNAEPAKETKQPFSAEGASTSVAPNAAGELTKQAAEGASSDLILSAALEPPQSWLARNKYVVGVFLVIAGVIAALLLTRLH